ncbi:major facilitator superfamily domain-containing protein [Bisporella sp. PMI_857]|nr:major facilitator superfamily domain-containing protein [Bisporella sp. PMI_857]
MTDSQSKPTSSTPSTGSGAANVLEHTSTSDIADFPADANEKLSAAALGKRLPAYFRRSHQADAVGPPPDGGTRAWLQVLVGHLVVFNSWGYISAFGVFQAYYATTLDRSPSDISWIGSVQTFLIYFISTFSGRATDAGYYRHVLIAGLTLQLVGVFATSFATQYWQLFLAQGICVGLGDGLVFCPTVTLISTYFLKKRALAISGIANGFVTGGIVFTTIARQLLYKIGFPWTLRVMGFVILANGVIILSLARTRIPPRVTGPFIEFAAFKEASYVLFSSGMFLAFMGVYFAYYYVATFAKDFIGMSPKDSLNLLLVMNAIGIPGRIVPAILADRWLGPVNTLILFVISSGLLVYCWAAAHTINGLWAIVIIYGFFGAGVQSLFPPALGSLTSDLSKLGIRIGMVFSVISIGCLTGPPIAGAIIQANHGGYLHSQMFGGSIMICGATLLVGGRIVTTGFHLLKKA